MKISKLIKILAIGAITITAGLTIGLFCNVNTIRFPTVNILTSRSFNDAKKQQKLTNDNKNVSIDYASLPGTNYSVLDVLKGTQLISNGNYMFYYGSDAYVQTAKALYGWDETFPDISYEVPVRSVDSLMLTLYDFFYNSNNSTLVNQYGLSNIKPTFLNYIDVCATRDTIDGQALLNDRMYNLPNTYYPIGNTQDIVGVSRVWKVGNDIANPQYLPVVKNTTFDYKPNNSYYEFRPDDKENTPYQKVYFRNQDVVKNFQLMGSLCEKFANELGVSFNKEGTLFLIRYNSNNSWSYSSITSFNDVTTNFKNIVKFYNPDIKLDDDQIVSPDNNDSNNSNNNSTPSSQQLKIVTRKAKVSYQSGNNTILVNKKED